MKHRESFTDEEITYINNNFSWMSDYYKQIQGATIEKVTIGLSDNGDESMLAFPVLQLRLADGERYSCDILSAYNTDLPGVLVGLPYENQGYNSPNVSE